MSFLKDRKTNWIKFNIYLNKQLENLGIKGNCPHFLKGLIYQSLRKHHTQGETADELILPFGVHKGVLCYRSG